MAKSICTARVSEPVALVSAAAVRAIVQRDNSLHSRVNASALKSVDLAFDFPLPHLRCLGLVSACVAIDVTAAPAAIVECVAKSSAALVCRIDAEKAANERACLERFDHPNVLALRDVVRTHHIGVCMYSRLQRTCWRCSAPTIASNVAG